MVERKIVRTTCKGCHGGCGVLVTVEDGVIVHVEGDPEGVTEGEILEAACTAPAVLDPLFQEGLMGGMRHGRPRRLGRIVTDSANSPISDGCLYEVWRYRDGHDPVLVWRRASAPASMVTDDDMMPGRCRS